METRSLKKIRQTEAAKIRYHGLNEEEKKELNRKRALNQKRRRQRQKEMAELESILRQTNDIYDDPEIERQKKAFERKGRNAKAKKEQYQAMSSAEELQESKYNNFVNENNEDVEVDKRKNINFKKALAARTKYHRMTAEEKQIYNQRRCETLRRRRQEEAELLATPIGQVTEEILAKVQQIIIRNAKRSENARRRYQRMTPDERNKYNQRCKEYMNNKRMKKELLE